MVGVVYATTLALFMNLTNPRVGCHAIPVYMALLKCEGRGGRRRLADARRALSAPACFGLGAMVEVLPLVLLPLAGCRRAQADFARDTASGRKSPDDAWIQSS